MGTICALGCFLTLLVAFSSFYPSSSDDSAALPSCLHSVRLGPSLAQSDTAQGIGSSAGEAERGGALSRNLWLLADGSELETRKSCRRKSREKALLGDGGKG